MTIQHHITASGHRMAYQHQIGSSPGVVFCCGFRSDMASTKATALAEWCAAQGIAFTDLDTLRHTVHGLAAAAIDRHEGSRMRRAVIAAQPVGWQVADRFVQPPAEIGRAHV